MAYVVKLTVISLLIAVVCSSGLVNVLNRKINAIKDGMEAEIALLRHDIGNVSSQLAHLLHGTDGLYSKVQNVSQFGCEEAEKGPTSDQYIFNQVIRKGFESEKKSLKNDFEMIHRYVNSTINDVDRMGQSLTSYKADLSDTKSHVQRINDITVNQSRDIKTQMDTFITKLDTLNEAFKRGLDEVKRNVSALYGFDARINKLETDFNKRSSFQVLSPSSSVRMHNTSIYVLKENATDYKSATKVCSDIGGYVVEINSEEENVIITEMSEKSRTVYLGGSDRVTEGNWKWDHSGDRIQMRNQGEFQKWDYNQPNNVDSDEHCLVINSDGQWHDYNCNTQFAYVCEVGPVNMLAYW